MEQGERQSVVQMSKLPLGRAAINWCAGMPRLEGFGRS